MEPTAGLDPVNAKKLNSISKKLKNERQNDFRYDARMTIADELWSHVSFIFGGEIA